MRIYSTENSEEPLRLIFPPLGLTRTNLDFAGDFRIFARSHLASFASEFPARS